MTCPTCGALAAKLRDAEEQSTALAAELENELFYALKERDTAAAAARAAVLAFICDWSELDPLSALMESIECCAHHSDSAAHHAPVAGEEGL